MENNIPLYQKIFNELEKEILEGKYSEGDLFPSENELQKKYEVSRITVRRSMEMLQNKGYVEKFSGKGTVVKNNRKTINLRNITGFSRDNENYNASSKLIKFERVLPSPKIKERLILKPEECVYKLQRLRLIDNEVIGLHTSFIPTRIIKLEKANFTDKYYSLYSSFEENNIKINSADETIEVRVGDSEINNLLNLPLDFPTLYIERTTFDQYNNPIEYVEIYYQTNQYKYQTKFQSFS